MSQNLTNANQSKPKIRLAMIGGGQGAFIGAVHRHALLMDGQFTLCAGSFSRDPENNHATANELGLPAERIYSSWQNLIESEALLPTSERVQAIAIVTPNSTHVPIAQAAAAAGIHVLCEKPLGVNTAEVKALASVLQQNPISFVLAHTYIGYPMVWQARHMVASGQLGDIRKINVEYPQGWLSEFIENDSKQASWRTDPTQSGASGCMGDIGTHAFNLAEFVSGHQINQLAAMLNKVVPGRALDDDGAALFRTAQGASGTLIASQVCAGEENAPRIRIYGSKGGLDWSHADPSTLIHRPLNAPYRVLRAGQGMPELCAEASALCRTPGGHPEGYLEAFANLYAIFAASIRQEKSTLVDSVPGIEAGMRGMTFIDTMLTSAANNSAWTDLEVSL